MDCMVARFTAAPEHVPVQRPDRPGDVLIRRVEAEADEMHSFMQKTAHEPWLWLAIDSATRHSIALHVGDRSRKSARRLWANLPAVYRKQATFDTEQYVVYLGEMPADRHKAITKKARLTHHIERFNHTLRQRVSRFVRATLAFSKKLENLIGAIRDVICHDTLTRTAA